MESKRPACADVGGWDQFVMGDRHMGHSVREWAQSGRVAWWLQGVNTAVGSASRGPERKWCVTDLGAIWMMNLGVV